jgi:hypothetical protein
MPAQCCWSRFPPGATDRSQQLQLSRHKEILAPTRADGDDCRSCSAHMCRVAVTQVVGCEHPKQIGPRSVNLLW